MAAVVRERGEEVRQLGEGGWRGHGGVEREEKGGLKR